MRNKLIVLLLLLVGFLLTGCKEKYFLTLDNSQTIVLKEGEEVKLPVTYSPSSTINVTIEKPEVIKYDNFNIIAIKEGNSKVEVTLVEDPELKVELEVKVEHIHKYIEEIVSDKYLKSEANENSPKLYYKSCKCGDFDKTEIFEYGNKLEKFTISYDYGYEDKKEIVTYIENENIMLLDPERIGYDFLGWFENDIKVEKIDNKNYNLIAKWEISKYSVKYYLDNEVYLEVTIQYGQKSEEIECLKPDDQYYSYNFFGWSETGDMDDLFNFSNPIEKDIELHAVFELIELKQEFRVTYYNDLNRRAESLKVKRGECAQFLDLPKADSNRFTYTVEGWYTNILRNEKYDFSKPVYEDLELYVKYNFNEKDRTGYELEGKRISFLGDSISTFYSENSEINSYYGGTNQFYYPIYSSTVKEVEKTWWYKTYTDLGLKLSVNNSWSGSSMNASNMMGRIATLGEKGKPDIIIIFLGTNDNVNGYVNEFKPAYEKALKEINKLYPDAYVFLCTMGYSAYNGYYYTEQNRLDFNDQIRDLAESYHCGVIEFSEIQTKDNYTIVLGDALHPNAVGMEKYAEKAIKDIKKYFE